MILISPLLLPARAVNLTFTFSFTFRACVFFSVLSNFVDVLMLVRFASLFFAGAKFKTKDLVALVSGGTSFTASGQVEVTKYAPGLR